VTQEDAGTISSPVTWVADIPPGGMFAAVGALPAGEALWRFSLAFYARPGVSAALIALQDHHGLDVNLILFALWLGLSGRAKLDREALVSADRAIRGLRVEIIEPLRTMRRRLKPDIQADVRCLREAIKSLEIEAEKTAQHRLALNTAPPAADTGPRLRLADAHANLALCLGPETANGAEAAVIREALDGLFGGC
jgi:uncharacterized protein (TIGR02444 family)